MRATVRSLLDLVGYEWGPARTRVVLTSGGPRIASSRPRPSGHPVTRLMRVATGRDPERDILAALVGKAPRRMERAEAGGTARFAALAWVALPEGAAAGVAAHPRDVFPVPEGGARVGTDAGDLVGGRAVQVVVDGATPDEVAERIAAVRRRWTG